MSNETGMLRTVVICEKYHGEEIFDETLRPDKGLDHYVDLSEL